MPVVGWSGTGIAGSVSAEPPMPGEVDAEGAVVGGAERAGDARGAASSDEWR